MKYNSDDKVITINREEIKPFNTEDDAEGWRKFQGQTMQIEFENGTIIEFEAHNIREVESDNESTS